jgi:hypothetical protein
MSMRKLPEKVPVSGAETKKGLSPEQREELLRTLKVRLALGP